MSYIADQLRKTVPVVPTSVKIKIVSDLGETNYITISLATFVEIEKILLKDELS